MEAVVGVAVWMWVFARVGLAVNVSNTRYAIEPLNIVLAPVIMLIFYSPYFCRFTSSKGTKSMINSLVK